jgi:hypothetical protein
MCAKLPDSNFKKLPSAAVKNIFKIHITNLLKTTYNDFPHSAARFSPAISRSQFTSAQFCTAFPHPVARRVQQKKPPSEVGGFAINPGTISWIHPPPAWW